jgi:hypothetical protein
MLGQASRTGLRVEGSSEKVPRRRPVREGLQRGPTGEGLPEKAEERRSPGEDRREKASQRRPAGEGLPLKAGMRRPAGESLPVKTSYRRPPGEGPAGEGPPTKARPEKVYRRRSRAKVWIEGLRRMLDDCFV